MTDRRSIFRCLYRDMFQNLFPSVLAIKSAIVHDKPIKNRIAKEKLGKIYKTQKKPLFKKTAVILRRLLGLFIISAFHSGKPNYYYHLFSLPDGAEKPEFPTVLLH